MKKKIIIYYNKIRGQLWFRPLLFCIFSVAVALVSQQADRLNVSYLVPDIDKESIGDLLDTISASMLVISTFSVASMLSALSSASNTATPRSFKIVVKDDVSKTALSIFIGAFIFSIVATVALDNGYYDKTGRFILFLLTLLLFAVVILTFIRWVDRISRLGRLEHTIRQVETVTHKSLSKYIKHPYLKANAISEELFSGNEVYPDSVGYIQHVNLDILQKFAEENKLKVRLNCLPGKFVNKNDVIAYFMSDQNIDFNQIQEQISSAIIVGQTRSFEDDPRFGLISLAEIASRALSPGINDQGTAIQIIGSHERLFFLWHKTETENNTKAEVVYNRIEVPEISMEAFFDDAFRPIARDGASNIEVMLRLQNTFSALSTIDNSDIKKNAVRNSKDAYDRAESAISFKKDLDVLGSQCIFRKH